MRRLLFEYAKLLRLPGLGGLSLAPVFGALSLIELGVDISFIDLVLMFLLGIISAIYSFVSNDIFDIEIDKLSENTKKRPLVTGVISIRTAAFISALCILIAVFIAFFFYYRNHISFYFALFSMFMAAVLGTIYNVYGKKFSLSAFIAALAEVFLVLVGVFLLSPTGSLSIFTLIIMILMFNQTLFMTAVIGGIKDADHDYLLNMKTLALSSGVKLTKDKKLTIPLGFKLFGFGTRLISAIVLFIPSVFYHIDYSYWEIILLAFVTISVLIFTIKLLNLKSIKEDKVAKFAGLQGIIRYTFVPFLLLPLIDIFNALILIIFPIIWYIVFTAISGMKLFKDTM